jgi:hypothetical protein
MRDAAKREAALQEGSVPRCLLQHTLLLLLLPPPPLFCVCHSSLKTAVPE